jgi:aminopeptidase N
METPHGAGWRARRCTWNGGSAAFALLLFLSPLAADEYPRQPDVDIQSYSYRISLHDDTDVIEGLAVVDARFATPGVKALTLDLANLESGKGMEVESVMAAGAAASFTHRDGRLRIELTAPPTAGERRQFTIRYHGAPAGGLRIGPNRYGERTFFSANWPDLARQWLPAIDHPYDKAAVEFLIDAPARYQVVANGRLVETVELPEGRRLTHWKEAAPIPVWQANIGVARFTVRRGGNAGGAPMEVWAYPQDREKGAATFDAPARRAMAFFARRIGPYPYEKLAHVEAAGFEGGMEHASAIFYGEGAVTGKPANSLVAHETAHQWFGDSVTESDWDDVWLSEGFATYFQLLAVERYEGRDAFRAGLKRSREAALRAEKELPGVAVAQLQPWKGIPNGIVYQKGAWALHMLRREIGTAAFWCGIRQYYRRFRDSNASTADFRRVMEEAAGVDLGWFFDQWIYRAGSPALACEWHYDAARRRLTVDLAQTQPGAPYRLRVDLAVRSGGGPARVKRLRLTERRRNFEIPLSESPREVTIDPGVWLMGEWKIEQRSASAPRQTGSAPPRLPAAPTVSHASPHFSQMFGRDDVARALLPAAPALMPALGGDALNQARKRVERSLDTADTSARATYFFAASGESGADALVRGRPPGRRTT